MANSKPPLGCPNTSHIGCNIQNGLVTDSFVYGDLSKTVNINFSPPFTVKPNVTANLFHSAPSITTFPVNGTMYADQPVQNNSIAFDTSTVTGDTASCAGPCVFTITIARTPATAPELGVLFIYVETSTESGNPGTVNSVSDTGSNTYYLVGSVADNQAFGSTVLGYQVRLPTSAADTVTVKWNVPAATTVNIALTFGLYKNVGGIGNIVVGPSPPTVTLNVGRQNSWAVGGDLSVLDSCTITAGAGLTQRQNNHANCLLHGVFDLSYDDSNSPLAQGNFVYGDSATGVANVYVVFELIPSFASPSWAISNTANGEMFGNPSHEMSIVGLETAHNVRWGLACMASTNFVANITLTIQLSLDFGSTWASEGVITGNSTFICNTFLHGSTLFNVGTGGTGGNTNNPGLLRVIGTCTNTKPCSTNLFLSVVYAPQNTILFGGVTIVLDWTKTTLTITVQLPSNALSNFNLQVFWQAEIT